MFQFQLDAVVQARLRVTCVQVPPISSAVPTTSVRHLLDQERACKRLHVREPQCQAIALDHRIYNVVSLGRQLQRYLIFTLRRQFIYVIISTKFHFNYSRSSTVLMFPP